MGPFFWCTLSRVSRLVGTLGVVGVLSLASAAHAQKKECECEFSEDPWKAYGTKEACTAFTENSGDSCEIAFGGLGATDDLVAEVLGQNPEEYRGRVYANLQLFLEARSQKDIKALTGREFLQEALPIFMRGAFLRKMNPDDASKLNSIIEGFVQKFSDKIANAFLGQIPSFAEDFEGASFEVGEGWISVEYHKSRMLTKYIPEGQQ